jgi:transient receptor potential cation channel subfamily M protein 5
MFFVTIIAIFICAFGVTTQALLYPHNELNLKLFLSIIHKAYWPIYGEIKILEEDIKLNSFDCDAKNTHCPEPISVIFTFFSLMIYMVIANVLLINLLIAMFR